MTEESESTPALEFRNVSLSFGETQVLRDISFQLLHGQMICITGASASGKSVLVHLAAGFIKADQGQIFVEGREIENLGEREILEIRGSSLGIVFQDDALFTGLTVYDNAAFRLAEHGVAAEKIDQLVIEALRFVGIDKETERVPEELSGGMKRRLEFARALVGWPRIMLYDEPTEGLDPLNAEQMLEVIIRARDLHHSSSLLVTKNLEEIPYLSSRRAIQNKDGTITIQQEPAANTSVILLDKGRIAFRGAPTDFMASTLPSVTYMTHAENGTHISDTYFANPWSKKRRPRVPV
jgi:phospholipid/cholesterol/gamma-HCH transport system ATP-binding protein